MHTFNDDDDDDNDDDDADEDDDQTVGDPVKRARIGK